MGVVDPLKDPSSAPMTWSDNFKFNPNYVNRSCPKNISCLPLVESSAWNFHVMTFSTLSAGKVKSTLTLRLEVISPQYLCHCITAYFSLLIFSTSLLIIIFGLYPLSNRMWKFLNFALTFLVLIHQCRIGE